MNPTLTCSSSLRSPRPQELRHRRNISTDSCDYEKLPSAVSGSRTGKRQIRVPTVSKSSVTEDARKVLDRFLKHLTPDEERLLRNYFGAEKQQQEEADEHTYVSYVSAKQIDRSSAEDFNDVYQSFRQFHDKEPIHHHYYDIDQSPQPSRKDHANPPKQTNVARASSQVRAEEYISRLRLGRNSESSCAKTFPPVATGEEEDRASSSSTEDYEFPDKELLNRKKKSTFRLALERVQQSFKRQKEKAPLTTTLVSPDTPSIRSPYSTPHKKRHPTKKSNKSEEKVKDNKNFFEAIIHQLRRKRLKLGRKPVKDHRSRSADNLNTIIRPLRPDERKLLERYKHAGYSSDSNSKSRGPEFVTQRPPMPLPPPDVFRDLSLSEETRPVPNEIQCPDEVDGDFDKNSSSSSIVPFNLKTPEEKDELFGRIADQLAAIADNYKMAGFASREDPSTQSDQAKGLTLDQYVPVRNATQSQPNSNFIFLIDEDEKSTCLFKGAINISCAPARCAPLEQGAMSPSSIAAELAGSPSYSKFEEILSANVGLDGAGWRQVAFVFRLTRSAVHLAGMGTSVASTMREFTIKYFEEKFASWIADRGGWESMVEDGNNTELNSELD